MYDLIILVRKCLYTDYCLCVKPTGHEMHDKINTYTRTTLAPRGIKQGNKQIIITLADATAHT